MVGLRLLNDRHFPRCREGSPPPFTLDSLECPGAPRRLSKSGCGKARHLRLRLGTVEHPFAPVRPRGFANENRTARVEALSLPPKPS